MEITGVREFIQKYRFLIWPITVGIASFIIIILVIIPQLIDFWNERNQISQLKNRLFILDAKADELTSVDINQLKQDLISVYSILPADRGIPEAVSILQSLISQSQLSLKSITFLSSGKTTEKANFHLSIIIAGKLNNIRNFLIALQNAPRLYQVEAINAQFNLANGEIETEIPIAVFYEDTVVKVGNVDQTLPKFSDQENQLLVELAKLSESNKSFLGNTATGSAILGKDNPFE